MQLKSIEIKGFKSFYNKTNIVFPGDGLVSIVGPNGSGKSNLLDAFRWVLGEQSAKSLRGEKMEDIIFSGTQYKKPMNVCEVEIIFDNSDRSLNIEYDEVSIRRKAYRSGESSYYLNNRSCRLKDVKELLMDSGIGREGYSIIGQGKVDEIVNGSPLERRRVFEEACGITRYRYKKDENQRKLEKVKVNLERIEDIYTEIERTVIPLEKEKKKAEQYFEWKKELKVSELNLILKETQGLLEKLRSDEEEAYRAEIARKEIEEKEEELYQKRQELEEKIAQREQMIKKIEAEVRILFEEQMETENRIGRNRDIVQAIHEQERYRLEEEDNLTKEIEFLQEQQKNREQILMEKQNAKTLYESRLELAKDKEEKSLENLKNLEKEVELQKAQLYRFKEEYGSLNSKLELIQERKKDEREKTQKSRREFDELSSSIKEIEHFLHQEEEESDELEKQKENLEKEEHSLELEKRELLSRLEEMVRKKNQFDLERSSLHSRLKMMYDMQQDFEGMPKTIRALLKHSGIKGLHNVVANIIEMEERYEVAIESALGASINHIVVQDNLCAKEAIAYLKQNKLGKVTMLPLDNLRINRPDLKGEKFANQVVTTAPQYRSVVDYLLGRTILCETIDSAIATAKKYRYLYRIVTLEGDIFNAGGSVTGGYRGQKTNLLSNKRVRRELEEQAKECMKQIQTLEERKNVYADQLQKVEERLCLLEKEKAELQSKKDKNYLSIRQMMQERQFLSLRYKEFEESFEHSGLKQTELEGREEESIRRRDELAAQIEEEAREAEEKTRKKEELQGLHQELSKELEELRIEVASLGKEAEGLQSALKLQQDNIYGLQRRIYERRCQKESDLKRLEELSDEEDELKRNLSVLKEKKAERENHAQMQKKALESDKMSQMELEMQKKQMETDKVQQMQRTFELEKRLNKNRLIVEHYNTKLQEEYFLNLAEIGEYRDENANTKKTYIQELRKKIDSLGNVNLNAIEQYEEVKERFEFYRAQKEDLTEAMVTTEKIIYDLKKTMAEEFKEEFYKINSCFKETFKALFGQEATAELVLSDENDLLNSDIEIKAQPPGKRLKSISAMSGGEKALTAIGILFAILIRRPTPFCYLDEIDASLDEINVQRFNGFLKEMSDDTQFVTITHRRGTMKSSRYIYGVTMEEKGISKVISMELAEAGRFIEE